MTTPPSDGWSGVQAEDVVERWPGGDPPLSDQQITTQIRDAEDAILREFPDMPARLLAGTVPARRIARVIARMVIRLMRNPEGLRTVQQGEGSFSGSLTYAGDHPGEVYLTDEDRRDLAGKARSGRGAFGIRPRFGR